MDYNKHYNKLISKAKNRTLVNVYTEEHHIVPRCMGGSNKKSNKVRLLAEEHYIAHLLLAKMHPDNDSLLYAANMMSNRNNKTYSWARKRFAKMHSKRLKGRKLSKEHCNKISAIHKDVPKSKEHKSKIADAHTKRIEYNGVIYLGWNSLKNETGVSRHNYLKYYSKGIDPTPYINNNSYAIAKLAKLPHNHVGGKVWCNNGIECKYFDPDNIPSGWIKGRLKNAKSK